MRLAAQAPVPVPTADEPGQPLTRPVLQEPAPPQMPAPPASATLWTNPATTSSLATLPLQFSLDCTTCGWFGQTAAPAPPANPNAPWVVQGAVRHTNRLGTFSAGAIGVRNYALPLFMAMPPGQDFRPVASTSQADLSVRETQWHVTTAFSRRLWTHASGANVGVTADVLLPVRTGGHELSKIAPLPSRAVRVGAVVRW